MPNATWIPEADCAIAQSLGVLGDAWDLLLIRDLARGNHRFDELARKLNISRKVLTERLNKLLTHDLIDRQPYSTQPVRHEYRLTEAGRALVPVLVGLQDWGDTWLLGDGEPTGLGGAGAEQRVAALAGTRVPRLSLPSTTGENLDVLAEGCPTVLFGYPLASKAPQPVGFERIPGALGCTLENRLFREAYRAFLDAGAQVRGVSTQSVDDQLEFAKAEGVRFPLLSDAELHLTMALRLPTFSLEYPRLRRLILIVGADRVITHTLFPITDIPAAVLWALAKVAPSDT